MTTQEIIELAGHRDVPPWVMKLVADCLAKEREEIVQFIESTNLGSLPEETAVQYANLLRSYSTAIRARGQQ